MDKIKEIQQNVQYEGHQRPYASCAQRPGAWACPARRAQDARPEPGGACANHRQKAPDHRRPGGWAQRQPLYALCRTGRPGQGVADPGRPARPGSAAGAVPR